MRCCHLGKGLKRAPGAGEEPLTAGEQVCGSDFQAPASLSHLVPDIG